MSSPKRTQRLALALFLSALSPLATRAVAQVSGVEDTASHPWSDIKNDTYEQRAHFTDGTGRMMAKLDREIRELRDKRAGMTTDTKDWDFLMKDVDDSRALLVGRIEDISKTTTPETWADAKDKVGDAWHRAQLAVDKMNSARTS
jgi:hypothetical protein